ncbi:ketoacyl-ACP synthase III [Marinomonas mediterranea]|uniref:ketoacyl-ACP synthase III n=1 Tax=Marinomonas mediterranea TaxID=119864 RepID=UPI00234BD42D|nr:ketoacyl-ACP synthase III [Marinomonas mediterranea]WCN07587.1 ketoacyl-ACP synthase III [Marinomonas mediterranea]WCN11686.1 ketoacyl-ACP synthase III [Marinomonas mediterranea]
MIIKGNCQIAGIGAYFPEQVVTSKELMFEINSEKNYGLSESWLDDVCGIEKRRVARPDELPSTLAIIAGEEALKTSGVSPSEIDAVIFCGISKEWIEPSIAHKVQHELGCTNAMCFDVSNACHGFMNGIMIADQFMQSSNATHVLVVTGEVTTDITSHYIDKLKKNKADLKKEIGALTLGDGGAAMILTPKTDTRGFQFYNLYTNGKYADLCKIGATKNGYNGQMVMGKISSMMIRLHSAMIEKTYSYLNWSSLDVGRFICHQVGKKPHIRMSSMANVSPEITPISYKDYGNIATVTIPFNIYNAKPEHGEKVLVGGAGSGMSISQSGIIF